MDFFSSSFNIIIAILIVSAVIWSFVSGRVPKEGTPARKKYDEKMAKEEWERLNPPIYKTIEEISKPKPKPKAKKQQDYVEPVITEKMIDDFVRFFDRSAPTDFGEIDFSDLDIDFSVEIECDISVYEYGDIKCEELELSENIWVLTIGNIENDVEELANWIAESLNDFRLRRMIREKTNNVQDQIAAQAIKSIYS